MQDIVSLRKKEYRDFQELEGLPARTEIEVKQNVLPCVAIMITKTVIDPTNPLSNS